MESKVSEVAAHNPGSSLQKPLRVWPAAALATLQILSYFVLPRFLPDTGFIGFLISLVAAALVVLWWLFFSRAKWPERFAFLLLMVVGILAASRLLHFSVAGTGQGMFFYFFAAMSAAFALAATTVIAAKWVDTTRRIATAVAILLACGVFTLLRNEGVGSTGAQFKWRWSQTPEEQLLAQVGNKPLPPLLPAPATVPTETPKEAPAPTSPEKRAATPAEPAAPAPAVKWPGFRGPHRDSIIPGVRIETNWSAAPPKELWRRAVGPGWSSFAVRGDLIYTQEQRGEHEVVSCYNVTTGQPVWEHRDNVRFWEANAGAGPRGTPTLHGDRLYTFGATGILNALNADTGTVIWTRNAATDADRKVPYWGFAGSPLVVSDMVVAAVSGRLAAYDAATGNPRWLGPKHSGSYSSPHLLTIGGVTQIALPTGDGITSVSPADGAVLWEYAWAGGGAAMLQPNFAPNGDLLITTNSMGGGEGMRRISVKQEGGKWSVTELWTSRGLKPQFNDFVVHKNHAYGFDNIILSCIELENGERKWKGGRYGQGQLVLLPDQDLLLVISEEGELALVSATPDGFKEVARIPALDGKTWNHPALVGDVLLVRNDREMVAYRLPGATLASK